jgi:hypothetical protein
MGVTEPLATSVDVGWVSVHKIADAELPSWLLVSTHRKGYPRRVNTMAEQIRSAELLVTKALSSPETIQALRTNPEQTLKGLSNEVVQQLPRLQPPDGETTNAIWLVIVIAFAAVMVGAAYVLGAGVTNKLESGADYVAKSDTILTVFTTVVAFLAGLLSPSPVKK